MIPMASAIPTMSGPFDPCFEICGDDAVNGADVAFGPRVGGNPDCAEWRF